MILQHHDEFYEDEYRKNLRKVVRVRKIGLVRAGYGPLGRKPCMMALRYGAGSL